jgi:hypothetical protein
MDNFSIVSTQFMITHVCYILLMVVIYGIYTVIAMLQCICSTYGTFMEAVSSLGYKPIASSGRIITAQCILKESIHGLMSCCVKSFNRRGWVD